jgi:hypothetical protein
VGEILTSKQITVLKYPPYSSDLAHHDFFSFPEGKGNIERRHFDDIDDIRSNRTAILKAIPRNEFQNCFEGWTRSWHLCIGSQKEYFEGDHTDFQQ